MENIVLSFCIPTYNRADRINKLLKHLINYESDEIEFVISDNVSTDNTEEIVRTFKDPRIKYFRNKKNYGMDVNFLLVIKRAIGKFIFLLMDEDEVEFENVPWIIKNIKANGNLSQLCGSIGDKRPRYKGDYANDLRVTHHTPRKFEDILMERYLANKNYSHSDIRFKFKDETYKKGIESLRELLFYYPHGSGIVLKRKILDLSRSLKYVGISFMHQVLIAQALINGDTLSTSRIIASFGKEQFESRQDLFKGKNWWHPISKLKQTKFRVQIIYDITKHLKFFNRTRRELLKKQYDFIYTHLLMLLFTKNTWNFAVLSADFQFKAIFLNLIPLTKSLKDFLSGIAIVLSMKNSLGILIYLLYKTMYGVIKSITKNFNLSI